MGEWEGLESRLKDLGEEAARLVDDPLDPARVRRIADRRRLRRSVVAVLIAVAILVSGGVGVYAVTSQPQRHAPSPAGDPTSTPTPTPSPEPSEEASGYGQRIPSATSEPGRGRQQVPPTYPRSSYSADPTPESPTPSETPTPSPTETSEEPESPEPTSTATEEPEPPPTTEPTSGGDAGGPTQIAPPPGEGSTADG
jgi:hypothetical protein